MGHINLFTSSYTEGVEQFLAEFQDGLLRPIGGIRMLDDREIPHVKLYMHDVEHDYILVEITDPLTKDDVNWLYRSIVAGEWEFTKKGKNGAFRYSITRVLNPGVKLSGEKYHRRRLKTTVETSEEWDKVNHFRRKLEAPILAFQHYNDTFQDPSAHLKVSWHGNMLVIEYDGHYEDEEELDEEFA